MNASTEKVFVVGGGIIGTSIAYYLSKRGLSPVVIERSDIASAASGKAGGFLARDWGIGTVTQHLHQVSFDLHEDLAKELGIDSFRRLPTLSVEGGKPKGRQQKQSQASWLDGEIRQLKVLDTGTAQVTPAEITRALMDAALRNGAALRNAAVTGVRTEPKDGGGRRLTGLCLEGGEVLDAGTAVFAMGPWSSLAGDWLGVPIPMEGVKSTSIVYSGCDSARDEPFALFCAEDSNGCHLEVFPRPNGDVYICGCGGSDYVGGERLASGGDCEAPEKILPDPQRVKAASASFAGLSSLGAREPDLTQACMRPCPPDALPIMGKAPGTEGAYLACGHNCWGILWGPVTGLAMSELIADGNASCVDLAPFSPSRFMPRKGAGARGRKRGLQAVGEQW